MCFLCRNFPLRFPQLNGWRVIKDCSTLRSRPCHLYTHRWVTVEHTNTSTAMRWLPDCLFFSPSFVTHFSKLNSYLHTHYMQTAADCFVAFHLLCKCSITNHLSSVPGQPPGALLHPLPRPRGRSYVPSAGPGREDSREQAGAWAETQHHLPVIFKFGASGPLPPPGAW